MSFLSGFFKKTVFLSVVFAASAQAAQPAPVVDLSQPNNKQATVAVNQQATTAQPAASAQSAAQTQQAAPAQSTQTSPTATMPNNNSAQQVPSAVNNNFSGNFDGDIAQPQTMTTEQRLARLEQQMSNLISMDLTQQITQLRQQVQQLTGQLQVQQHDLKLLNDQQRSFYQDLNNRLTHLKTIVSGSSDDGSSGAGSSNSNPTTSSPAKKPAANSTSMPAKSSSSQGVSGSAKQELASYQNAFKLVSAKQFKKAEVALTAYISDYTNGQYVAGAHYWLGEIYRLQNKNQQAKKEFQLVISKYPNSNKVANARLKLAVIHANTGQVVQAQKEFQAIKTSYPGSTVSQLASIQLQQLSLKSLSTAGG